MKMRSLVVACALWTVQCNQQKKWPQDSAGPLVEVEHGIIEGSTRSPKRKAGGVQVDGFFGIPYADPPLWKNRFRAPQPYSAPWGNSTRNAKKTGPTCPQLDIIGKVHFGDENCLHLNVYRPSQAEPGSDLAVLFWIYGGGFFMGDSYNFIGKDGDGLYDGFNVVSTQQHIVVTHNYRLNAMGYMALPELELEDPSGSVGNWGTMDQRAALQWVQRNIRSFGGDPGKVTIVGESAGGISVAWHLTSPQSKGLFHGAIIQSGCTQNQWFFQKKAEAVEFYIEWARILGCEGQGRLECLRELPQEKMMVPVSQWVKDWFARFVGFRIPADVPEMASPLFPAAPFAPVIDGTEAGLPDMPIILLEKGEFHKVPLIVGGNLDDGAYLGPLLPLLWGAFPFFGYDLDKLVSWFLPDTADQQRAKLLYGEPNFPPSNTWHKDAYKRFFRDSMFACATRDFSTIFSKFGMPVYTYVMSFDYKERFALKSLQDAHAFELVFTWRNGEGFFGTLRFDRKLYEKMANIMSCTWSSFVVCQKPKCDVPVPGCADALQSMVDWPAFNGNTRSRQYLSVKETPTVEIVPRTAMFGDDEFPGDDRCDFWRNANMDWQGIRHGVEYPDMNGCQQDGMCADDGYGCCSGIGYKASKCSSGTKCGCVEDGVCLASGNDESVCCSGEAHTSALCLSLKQCGTTSTNTTLI
jgi:carboxylesterase type B